MLILRSLLVVVLAAYLGACRYMPGPSDSYPATSEEVRAELTRMKDAPVELERPLVIMDGWVKTGGGNTLRDEMIRLTGAPKDMVHLETYGPGGSAETKAAQTIRHIEENWPSDDPDWTVEVDVIGFSNGGVYARVAAEPPMKENAKPRKRLRIKRLFTVSSPHRGVRGGIGSIPVDPSVADVQPGSKTLVYLDERLPDVDYELTCYAEVNDEIVGAKNTAPPGQEPIWTSSTHLMSHMSSAANQRILADIALRLRGETPLAGEPSAPPKH